MDLLFFNTCSHKKYFLQRLWLRWECPRSSRKSGRPMKGFRSGGDICVSLIQPYGDLMTILLRKKMELGRLNFRLKTENEGLAVDLKSSGAAPTEYTMHGRRGLYYRETYKGGRLNTRQAQEPFRGFLLFLFFLSVALVSSLIVIWPNPYSIVFTLLLILTVGGTLMIRDAEHGRRMYEAKQQLDKALIDPASLPTEEEVARLSALNDDIRFPEPLLEDMYLAILDRVIDDRKVTDEESRLLTMAQEILKLNEHRITDLHKEVISSAWIQSLIDGHLSKEDLGWIEQLAADLNVPEEMLNTELQVAAELADTQQLPKSLSAIDTENFAPVLQEGETLYAAEPVKFLSPRITLGGTEQSVELQGTLLVTSKRVFVQNAEEAEIPLEALDAVEVDVDERHVLLHLAGDRQRKRIDVKQPVRLGHLLSLIPQTA